MDPERQPLLHPTNPDVRQRLSRPLTFEEVQRSREQVHWSRARCVLVFLFWCVMVASLSLAARVLAKAPGCYSDGAAVPPVHLTLAPLLARSRAAEAGFMGL